MVSLVALFLVGSMNHAEALGPKDLVKFVEKNVKKLKSKKAWQDKLCKKASFFSGDISLRSGKGILCKTETVGVFAMSLCYGYSDFKSSGCYKNASKYFKTSKEAVKQIPRVIAEDAVIAGKLVCMAAPFVPAIGEVALGPCLVLNAVA